jgi:dolichol kinase
LWKARADWWPSLVREVRRKLIHLTGLTVPACILLFGITVAAAFVAVAMTVALVLEFLRLRGLLALPAVREGEQARVAGYVYYILGSLLTLLFFPPMIALTAILMLSLGDTASGIIGSVLQGSEVRDLGSNVRKVKPLPAGLGIFFVSLLVGYISSSVTDLPFVVYLAGAVGATFADVYPVFLGGRALDDNFTIPLYASVMMSLASLV